MATVHTTVQKTGKSKKDYILQNHAAADHAHRFLQEDESINNRNLLIKFSALKRISPFLVVEVCLPALFVYSIIKYSGHTVMFLFLFLFVAINAITIDFALWNYHRKNKIWMIWAIELTVIVCALYFIL